MKPNYLKAIVTCLSFMLFSKALFAAGHLSCEHTISGVPFATTILTLGDDGIPNRVQINHYGSVNDSKFRIEETHAKERFHMTLDVDHPGSEIILIVYKSINGETKSELINEHSPIMKVLPGICTEN